MTNKKKEIDFEKVYESLYDGPYKIIEDLGANEKRYHMVLIRFLNTGNIQEAIFYRAERGQVKDKKYHTPEVGKIYSTVNYGDLVILENLGGDPKTKHIMVKYRFILTGTEGITSFSTILKGNLKDNFLPTIYGVGYIGNADVKHHKREYQLWEGMLDRCYNEDNRQYEANYGGAGVTVCKRWHCFEYFLEDLQFLPNYNLWINDHSYSFDKDYLQQDVPTNKKVYSPTTCMFVTKAFNSRLNILYNNDYIGVAKARNNYKVSLQIGDKRMNIGTYPTKELATNAYNYAAKFYLDDCDLVLNNVQQIPYNEVEQQRTSKKVMCRIVESKVQRLLRRA